MKIRTIVVEDEELSMMRLIHLLNNYNDTIEIIDKAYNGIEAVDKINELKPDIVFLDIQIPGIDGFSVLNKITHFPFVVFVTAFDHYALKAFNEHSIDFVLKPISKKRLDKTIEKINHIFSFKIKKDNEKRDEIKKNNNENQFLEKERSKIISFIDSQIERLGVKLEDGYFFIKLSDIIYIKSEDKYSRIYAINNTKYLSDFSLIELENKYNNMLIRIHRNTLINPNRIIGLKKWFKGQYRVLMEDNSLHDVSKRQLQNLKNYFVFKL